MKKMALLIIMSFSFLLIGCEKKPKVIKREGNGDIVVEYTLGNVVSYRDSSSYSIFEKVYDDKTCETGIEYNQQYRNEKEKNRIQRGTINDENYQILIDYIYSEKVLNLEKDLAKKNGSGTLDSNVIIYYEDGSTMKISGLSIYYQIANKIRDLIVCDVDE